MDIHVSIYMMDTHFSFLVVGSCKFLDFLSDPDLWLLGINSHSKLVFFRLLLNN